MAPFEGLRRALSALEASCERIHMFGSTVGLAFGDAYPAITHVFGWMTEAAVYMAVMIVAVRFTSRVATKTIQLLRKLYGWLRGR